MFAVKFPDTVLEFLVLQIIFPDNLRRELPQKSLQDGAFLQWNPASEPQNRKIPCKIP
jgi:hypothetical protein